MKPYRVKLAEWGCQFFAVFVLVMMGLDSYERSLSPTSLENGRSIGFLINTNSDLVFWHLFLYGLYIITWVLFFYGIFKRYENSLRKKILNGVAGWIMFSLIHTAIVFLAYQFIGSVAETGRQILHFSVTFELGETIFDLYFFLGIFAFMAQTTIQFLSRYHELEEADHIQTELSLIRSQLRPHFFFNTLNNLYSMALETGNADLADGIQNLTGMMRYSLKHSTKKLVPLDDEWEYVKKYVALQKLRFQQESVKIKIKTEGAFKHARVAPMILINFVENAFKHGISYEHDSYVYIKLAVDENTIVLHVRNSNYPSHHDTGDSGIGTAQTKRLLGLYYNDDFNLAINTAKNEHIVTLKLPIK